MVELETTQGVKDLHKIFVEDVYGIPDGEKIKQCQQCGTCSGSCPTAYLMDYGPREVIAAFRAGILDRVVKSNTIWLCTSCYSCTVRCPAGIKVTDIMYELKRLAIKYDSVPAHAKTPPMSKIFIDNVHKYGRSYEVGLIAKFTMTKKPSLAWKFSGLGMKLLSSGRMPLKPHSIKGKDELDKIVAVLATKEVAE
jgi:heterodisulfide reductase subunit C